MKRVVRVLGKNGGSLSLELTAKLKGEAWELTQWEMCRTVEEVADELMKVASNVRYFKVPACKLRVKA